jgi:hypothetical protein
MLYQGTKKWKFISSKDYEKLNFALLQKLNDFSCQNLTQHKKYFMKDDFFSNNGITVETVTQNKNELIVIAPSCYHQGTSSKDSISESINFWLPNQYNESIKFLKCSCHQNEINWNLNIQFLNYLDQMENENTEEKIEKKNNEDFKKKLVENLFFYDSKTDEEQDEEFELKKKRKIKTKTKGKKKNIKESKKKKYEIVEIISKETENDDEESFETIFEKSNSINAIDINENNDEEGENNHVENKQNNLLLKVKGN